MDDDYFDQFDQPDHDIERIEEDNEAPPGPDEAEEVVVTARDVKPKKIVTRPRLKLDDKRLKGPRGLSVLEPIFKKAVLRGKGYERKDLDTVMSLLEHWAHRLFPKMTFDDCLEKIEDLGHKKSVSSYVTLLRNGCADEPVEAGNEDASGDVPIRSRSPSPQPTVDPFDQLLDRPVQSQLTQEQRDRMERNKLLALERRRAKLKAKYEKPSIAPEDNTTTQSTSSENPTQITSEDIIHPAVNETENNGLSRNGSKVVDEASEYNTGDIPMEADVVGDHKIDNKATETQSSDVNSTIVEDNSMENNMDDSKNVCFDSESNKDENNGTMDSALGTNQGARNPSENNPAE